jgi:hypothetical protein
MQPVIGGVAALGFVLVFTVSVSTLIATMTA